MIVVYLCGSTMSNYYEAWKNIFVNHRQAGDVLGLFGTFDSTFLAYYIVFRRDLMVVGVSLSTYIIMPLCHLTLNTGR